jgi:hypothetical protein
MKAKRKIHKTSDPNWDTHTYSGPSKFPFKMEMVKYYNPAEGRDQILFLYLDKETNKIVKYRTLR